MAAQPLRPVGDRETDRHAPGDRVLRAVSSTARHDDSISGPTAPRGKGSHADGTVLAGRYRIIRLLGRGGMGEVYEAFDEDLRVRIALKTLRPGGGTERAEALEWLKQELRVGRSVAHRNLCRLYDFGSDQGVHFITMELLRGPTLAQHLDELKRPLTQEELGPIVEQICAGLSELHGRDLVHLDIKPSNVVLEEDRVVVTDFGLAALQKETALGGSPWYMAPEQVERKAIDSSADVFALGVLIFEALTRKLPFPGSTDDEIARARLFMQPVELDSAPRPVRRLVSQCLSRDPRRRPQRATDVALRFTLKQAEPSRTLPWLVGFAAVAVLGVTGAVVKRSLEVKRPPRVVVLPFEGLQPGGASKDGALTKQTWIATTATQMAEAGLGASTDATLVPPTLAREALRDGTLTAPWPASFADSLGQRLDFDVWVTGKLSEHGENFHLHLEWPGGAFDGESPQLPDVVGDGLDAFRKAQGLKVDASARAAISRVPNGRNVSEACALGDLALANYQWSVAGVEFDQCLDGDASNIPIALRMAEVVERRISREATRNVLKSAWEHRDLLPQESRWWVEARYARALGNWSDSVIALNNLPKRAEVRFALAEAYAASGQFQEAKKVLDAEWAAPDEARAAYVEAQLEEGEAALRALERAEKLANARGQRRLEAKALLDRARRLVIPPLRDRKLAEDVARASQLKFRESGDLLGAAEAFYEVAKLQEARGVAPAISELRSAAKEAREADGAVACRLDVVLARGQLDLGQNALAKQTASQARHCLRSLKEPGLAAEATLIEVEVDRLEGFFTFIDNLAKESDIPEASDETRALAKLELAAVLMWTDEVTEATSALDAVLPTVKDYPRPHGLARMARAELALSQGRFDEAAKECDLGVTAVHGNVPLEWLQTQLLARKALAQWLGRHDVEARATLDEAKRVTTRGSGEWLVRLTEGRMSAASDGGAALKQLGEEMEKERMWVWGAEVQTVLGAEVPTHWGRGPKFAVRLGQLKR